MAIVAYTTLVLVVLTIMASMNFLFNLIFYLTALGQGLVVYMVYRVLKGNYKTFRTFGFL